MASFLDSIVTPAVVAGVISLLVTNRNEKIRARRDFITKAFDPARDNIKDAVAAALEYYPLAADKRTKSQEAMLLAAEREVRRSITSLLLMHEEGESASFKAAQQAFDDFVAELTSGSFQSADAKTDVAAAVRVADAGANLRAGLLGLRSEVLERAIAEDPLSYAGALFKGAMRHLRAR